MTDTVLPTSSQPPAVVLGAARAVVAGVGSTLWAARTPRELVDTVRACEVLRSALDAVQLQVVAEIDASNAAAVDGWASTKDFVTAVTGGTKGAGRRVVALARAVVGDRAVTGAALGAGGISRVQAEVVVAAVDRLPVAAGLRVAAERLLLDHAGDHDATDVARLGERVVERLDPDGAERREERALEREERAAHRGRFLAIRDDGIGGVKVTGRGTVEDAAQLRAVLFPLAAPRPACEPGACGGTPTTPAGAAHSADAAQSAHSAEAAQSAHAAQSAEAAQSAHAAGVVGAGRAGACGVAECAHDGRDPREHGVRMWDALIEASRLLAATEGACQIHCVRA